MKCGYFYPVENRVDKIVLNFHWTTSKFYPLERIEIYPLDKVIQSSYSQALNFLKIKM